MKKRIIAFLAAVILLLGCFSFFGCSEESNKIVVAIPFGHTKPVWDELSADYTRRTGVEVELLDKTAGYSSWLGNQIQDKEIYADIVTSNEFQAYYSKGIFTDYNAYLGKKNPYADNQIWRNLLDPAAYRSDGNDGETFMLNVESVQVAMFYNKTYFLEKGFKTPRTFDELIDLMKQINADQYNEPDRTRLRALYISGNGDSMINRDLAWLVRIYSDQYYRDLEPLYLSQPDDYNYRSLNKDWEYNERDPYNDSTDNAVFNKLRVIKDVMDGKLGPTLPNETIEGKHDEGRFAEMFGNIKRLIENTGYVLKIEGDPNASQETIMQENLTYFSGVSSMNALDSFYKGRAAMYMDSTGLLPQYERWVREDGFVGFELGSFFLPPMGVVAEDATSDTPGAHSVIDPDGTTRYYTLKIKDDSTVGCMTARSLGGPNGFFSVVKKSQQQTDLAMDFMMYFFSPAGQEVRIKAMDQSENIAPNGLALVKGVTYPERWASMFDSFGFNGECDLNPVRGFTMGLGGNKINANNYANSVSDYLYGKTSLQDFVKISRENIINGFDNWIDENSYRSDCLDDVTKNPNA